MEKQLNEILPIMGVEHDCILSKQGDITIVFKAVLPEIFTLSDQEYESFHYTWIKAIKALPKQSVFHKQDWFIESRYKPDFENKDTSFLTQSSERFFNERPFLNHSCYLMLTKKPAGRKLSSSLFSDLVRRSITPEQTLKPQFLQDFLDCAGQFKRIMEDSGFVELTRLKGEELLSDNKQMGLIERYCFLRDDEEALLFKDIECKDGLQIGSEHCQLYAWGDAEDLPALCGPRMNYHRYSSDKTKFSIGFASSLGQLLSCNHLQPIHLYT
jgi:conjugation system TraG family ATPase